MKVLIIQQKMIGDVLTSSILFEAIKEKYPNSILHYLINTHTHPVVENNPFIDDYIFISPEIEKSKLLFLKFLRSMKTHRYDVVIDVYGKISSNLISLFVKSEKKIAYHKALSSFIYGVPIKRKKVPEHDVSLAIENRMLLLEPLNIQFKNYKPTIYLNSEEKHQAKVFLENQKINLEKPLFMISVLGSSKAKTYPFKYMAELLDALVLHKPKSQILFNYIPKQHDDAKAIYDLCNKQTQKHIFFDVYGENLRAFLAITSHCNALIGNEGGAVNMAKALNIKTFMIFSPYLNKHNWFGREENKNHIAIHLGDYIELTENDIKQAKDKPEAFYLKLKPDFLAPQLHSFLSNFE